MALGGEGCIEPSKRSYPCPAGRRIRNPPNRRSADRGPDHATDEAPRWALRSRSSQGRRHQRSRARPLASGASCGPPLRAGRRTGGCRRPCAPNGRDAEGHAPSPRAKPCVGTDADGLQARREGTRLRYVRDQRQRRIGPTRPARAPPRSMSDSDNVLFRHRQADTISATFSPQLQGRRRLPYLLKALASLARRRLRAAAARPSSPAHGSTPAPLAVSQSRLPGDQLDTPHTFDTPPDSSGAGPRQEHR